MRRLSVGGTFKTTTIRNAGRDALAFPSDTLITISAVIPASAWAGVPDIKPVCGLIVAHTGSPVTLNVNASPSPSIALGWEGVG